MTRSRVSSSSHPAARFPLTRSGPTQPELVGKSIGITDDHECARSAGVVLQPAQCARPELAGVGHHDRGRGVDLFGEERRLAARDPHADTVIFQHPGHCLGAVALRVARVEPFGEVRVVTRQDREHDQDEEHRRDR